MTGRMDGCEALLGALGVVSAAMFFLTLAAVPWLVVRVPADYFTRDTRPPLRWSRLHPVARLFLLLAKNLAGAVLVGVGAVMLVLPGQGVLTILLGVMLLDFPGKYALERRLAGYPAVLKAMNWLRRRAGVIPIAAPRGRGG